MSLKSDKGTLGVFNTDHKGTATVKKKFQGIDAKQVVARTGNLQSIVELNLKYVPCISIDFESDEFCLPIPNDKYIVIDPPKLKVTAKFNPGDSSFQELVWEPNIPTQKPTVILSNYPAGVYNISCINSEDITGHFTLYALNVSIDIPVIYSETDCIVKIICSPVPANFLSLVGQPFIGAVQTIFGNPEWSILGDTATCIIPARGLAVEEEFKTRIQGSFLIKSNDSNSPTENFVVTLSNPFVVSPVYTTTLSLGYTDLYLPVNMISAYTLMCKVLPENSTHSTLEWVIENNNIASITLPNNKKAVITTLNKPGDTRLTVTALDSNVSVSCNLHVYSTQLILPDKIIVGEQHISKFSLTEVKVLEQLGNYIDMEYRSLYGKTEGTINGFDVTISAISEGYDLVIITIKVPIHPGSDVYNTVQYQNQILCYRDFKISATSEKPEYGLGETVKVQARVQNEKDLDIDNIGVKIVPYLFEDTRNARITTEGIVQFEFEVTQQLMDDYAKNNQPCKVYLVEYPNIYYEFDIRYINRIVPTQGTIYTSSSTTDIEEIITIYPKNEEV